MKSLTEVLRDITGSISRKKASFGITRENGEIILAAGSFRALRTRDQGFIITMSVSREMLIELRDHCNELLGD